MCAVQTRLSGLSKKSASLSFQDATLPSSILMARGAGAEAAIARLMGGVQLSRECLMAACRAMHLGSSGVRFVTKVTGSCFKVVHGCP